MDNDIQLRKLRCVGIHDQAPSMYAWFSLTGYMMAYFVLTTIRTAHEPKIIPDVISMTSRSECKLLAFFCCFLS